MLEVSRKLCWRFPQKSSQLKFLVIFVQSVIVFVCGLCQVLQIAGNYWMAWASPTTSGGKSHVSSRKLILVYVGLVFGSTIFVIIRSLLVELVGLLAAQKYFKGMVRCIFHAPMSFFDSTPTGRILNRVPSHFFSF
jgi:ABC-type multidrug transport system fused ATPase/permease subunit